MTRLPILAAIAALSLPGLAAAQTQDCIAAGLLNIDSIDRGTQRVPRDPRSGRDLITISLSVRNISTRQVTFTATFSAPPVDQSFVTGQSWTITPGQRVYFALANVLKPGMTDEAVRSVLKLNCN
ncbi:hypothetical protein [Roseococcus sp. YIM B11640]|uniref:hypothetical protein n=1 Tax=Roseococcus sp. YIM B11640 TaxID=3133973 RepID=UPI003C7A7D29